MGAVDDSLLEIMVVEDGNGAFDRSTGSEEMAKGLDASILAIGWAMHDDERQ